MKSHIVNNLVHVKWPLFIAVFSLLIALPLSAQEETVPWEDANAFQYLTQGEAAQQEETDEFQLSDEEDTKKAEDFWFSLGGDLALYSPTIASFGINVAVAYGTGTSIGLKASWFFDFGKQMNVLEVNVLLRMYFAGKDAISGGFAQLEGGPSIYFDVNENFSFPARIGFGNIGAALGWRFLLGKYFFIEPSVRGGYPYIAGVSVLFGMHF